MVYTIKKLIYKNRGIDKNLTGLFHYSLEKLELYESKITQTNANLKRFKTFKDATINKTPIEIYKAFTTKYAGVVLDNNMVINFDDISTNLLEDGDYFTTPKGRIKVYWVNGKYQLRINHNIDENLKELREPLYDLDYDDMTETLICIKDYTFALGDNSFITPKAVCSVPNYNVRAKFVPYFYTTTVRTKLLKKLKNINPYATLKTVLEMDQHLPADFREEHESWTPERRVYDYICRNQKFCYEYFGN